MNYFNADGTRKSPEQLDQEDKLAALGKGSLEELLETMPNVEGVVNKTKSLPVIELPENVMLGSDIPEGLLGMEEKEPGKATEIMIQPAVLTEEQMYQQGVESGAIMPGDKIPVKKEKKAPTGGKATKKKK